VIHTSPQAMQANGPSASQVPHGAESGIVDMGDRRDKIVHFSNTHNVGWQPDVQSHISDLLYPVTPRTAPSPPLVDRVALNPTSQPIPVG
jgi:hypothetical protein